MPRIVKPKRREEDTVQTHLAKLLTAYGRFDIAWTAIPSGGKRPIKTGIALKQQGLKKGVGDLFLLIDSQAYNVELKVDKNKQSEDQIRWQEQFERAGGIYYLVRGLDEALSVLQRIRAFRPGISFTSGVKVPILKVG